MASPQSALISDLTDEEFEHRTLDAVQREFGAQGLVRFLMTYQSGKGDYTAERPQWQADLTLESVLESLKNNAVLPK